MLQAQYDHQILEIQESGTLKDAALFSSTKKKARRTFVVNNHANSLKEDYRETEFFQGSKK